MRGLCGCVHDGRVQHFVLIYVWPVACVLRGQGCWKVFGGCYTFESLGVHGVGVERCLVTLGLHVWHSVGWSCVCW